LVLKRLPAAAEEGQAVVKCLEKSFKVVEGNDKTTKEAFLALKSPRLVYLATHGFFCLPSGNLPVDNPLLRCVIVFAGYNYLPNGKGKGTESLPGLLTGAEVLGANLHGTELVVLSACQSGRGEAHFGQSPADLRHAFHLAGARAVVSSLWSVDDESTRNLMVPFIASLAAKKPDKVAAFNQAQRRWIEQSRATSGHAHPFFWAAFTLSGF
jgi:CHAT domain-containing protein